MQNNDEYVCLIINFKKLVLTNYVSNFKVCWNQPKLTIQSLVTDTAGSLLCVFLEMLQQAEHNTL